MLPDSQLDKAPQAGAGCMVSHIHAFVRVRPLLPREFAQSTSEAVSVYEDQRIRACKDNTVLESDFDEVLGQDATQSQVFEAGQGCVDSVLEGYNGSILAYGATGSGKTFTMLGGLTENADDDTAGLIPRALKDLFVKTAQLGSPDDRQHCRICMSYVEIYNERLHDLLQPYKPNARLDPQDVRKRKAGLEVKERHGQTCVPGALLVRVDTIQAALSLVRKGNLSRAVRHTDMNQHSSRSHTILQVVVEQRLRGSMLRSKLNFVDLAGSERWSERVEMSEVRVSEMTSINQSLSTLITVVASLTEEGRTHIPYRDSKLTHLLQDSLGGNCNTTIIATVSPSALAFEETCATLKFADRARNIVNRATVNLHTDYKLELELKTAEVKRLTGLLAKFASMVDSSGKMTGGSGQSRGGGHSSGSGGGSGRPRSSSNLASTAGDKQRRHSMTEAEADSAVADSTGSHTAAQTHTDRPATSSGAGGNAVGHVQAGRAVSRSPSNQSSPGALPRSASERALGQVANPSWQNSSLAASANLAEVARLRAELLLAKEDLLAERAARLRLESVVVASQQYFSQRNPQHAGLPNMPCGKQHMAYASESRDSGAYAADSNAASTSYAASSHASQSPHMSFSAAQHAQGRSSMSPSQTTMGRSSLKWQPEVVIRSYSRGDDGTAALQWHQQGSSPLSAMSPHRYLPSEASASSFLDEGNVSPGTRNQSGSWGRSSMQAGLGLLSPSGDVGTALERQPMTAAEGSKTTVAQEDSGMSFVSSSPYAAKLARSPLNSKPSSPTKRNHVANSQLLLRNSASVLKDKGSLEAGSWIYILGNRGSSITAKQMAKSTRGASSML